MNRIGDGIDIFLGYDHARFNAFIPRQAIHRGKPRFIRHLLARTRIDSHGKTYYRNVRGEWCGLTKPTALEGLDYWDEGQDHTRNHATDRTW